jgi:C1A family cysteine protease
MSNYKSIKKIKSEMSVTNHHKLGLFEQKPLVLSAGYGKTIDWLAKGVVNPVFNEGVCGASWAFATADAIASAYKIKEGDQLPGFYKSLVDDLTKNAETIQL